MSLLALAAGTGGTGETRFPFFTDPVRYAQWMGSDVELEAKPGGLYRVRMRDGVEALGTFQEVDPPHRLVFTWGWVNEAAVPPGSTRVEVSFAAEDGGTRVTLRHHGLPTNDQRDHHRMGWEMYLGRLSLVLQGDGPGPDPNSS